MTTESIRNGIYFVELDHQETHFIAYKDGKILDPYDYYQFTDSHGFCQFFSFFRYLNHTHSYQKVLFDGTFHRSDFIKYVDNSYRCFQNILKLLQEEKYKTVYTAFKNDFQNYKTTPRKYFGIQRGTTFEQFLKDCEKIPYAQYFLNIRENYSSYEKQMKGKRKRQQFRKDSQNFFQEWEQKYKKEDLQPDKKLCVQPTDNESQFESFQAIITNSFRGGRNSVYSKLLKINNIQLIEKDIYELVKLSTQSNT